jgi:DNA modification methylase
MLNQVIHGDCLEVLRTMPDNSVDAVVTDPPYGLSREPDIEEVLRHWLAGDDYKHRGGGFMGKEWDSFVPGPAVWREVCRVVKPGGHILCFAGTRTVDLMGISLRLGGFEIRDCLQWLYGSGFPKSLDVSGAIDKKLGAERKTVGLKPYTNDGSIRGNSYNKGGYERVQLPITAPATPEAQQWDGWGTALKPANEPIVLARKPLSEKTIAENVMKWGTGGLNIEGCRIPTEDNLNGGRYSDNKGEITCNVYSPAINKRSKSDYKQPTGRFPANVILDEEAGRMLDEQQEGASRFFYCAKVSKKERNMGLEDVEPTTVDDGRNKPIDNPFLRGKTLRQNTHPTVKPVKLMEYLITLITPPNGIVLDPFLGSGTTALAALNLGRFFIGIELNEEYCEIARRRVASHTAQQELKFA